MATDTTDLEIAIGEKIMETLVLNRTVSGKIQTYDGPKTIQGIGALALRIVQEEINKSNN